MLKPLLLLPPMMLLFWLCPRPLYAQEIAGKVRTGRGEALGNSSIYWLGTSQGVSADEQGAFSISAQGIADLRLVASFVGYQADTLLVEGLAFVEFELQEIASLQEVTVTGRQAGAYIAAAAIKTEVITQAELGKAACCDLAGCFETQSTVQPQTTNVITNSKELRILGLSGVYNQVLIDGFPLIQGLSYTYGISSIPGTLVDNIYVAKGANSVLQGFESISGQINVETKAPDDTDRLLLNVYMNNFQEKHFNANYAFRKGKWSNLTAFHTVQPARQVDRDQDGFLDLPQLTRYMLFNKWQYGADEGRGWDASVGLRLLKEQRIGGQRGFDADTQQGSAAVYGQTVDIAQPEISGRAGFRFNDAHKLVLLASGFHHQQQSYFGPLRYDATQSNAYLNLQHEWAYGQNSTLKTGASFRYLNLEEDIAFLDNALQRTFDGRYQRRETIPGAFAENVLNLLDGRLTWIAGLRGDWHNEFGFALTPRTLLKYELTPQASLRASAGTGWRTVNFFSENIGLLASSRDVVFEEALRPERAANFGLNFTQKFEQRLVSGYFSLDYYQTNFQNQIFPDYDRSPGQAFVYNFTGISRSHGFQAEANAEIWERFGLRAGYNYLDVYRQVNENKELLPFNPRHKFLASFSYAPLSGRYHFDANLHWYGEQRLPDTRLNPLEFQRPDFSEPYTVVNAQFTYNFPRFELYAGCENIFDFRQLQPILGWQDPFGPYFDTAFVWGPTRGREWYVGGRFRW